MALQFHEYFTRIPVPGALKGKVIDTESKPLEFIENLSKINLFVGPNNSGKSYLLREILKSNLKPFFYSNEKVAAINSLFSSSKDEFFNIIQSQGLSKDNITFSTNLNRGGNKGEYISTDEIFSLFEDLKPIEIDDRGRLIYEIAARMSFFSQKQNGESIHLTQEFPDSFMSKCKEVLQKLMKESEYYLYSLDDKFTKVYIHSFRTLLTTSVTHDQLIKSLKKQNYIPESQNSYHKIEIKDEYANIYHVGSGLEIYADINTMQRDTAETQLHLRDYEHFLSENFFENQRVVLTPSQSGELRIKVGNALDRPIFELGTGIQMMIILTFPLFQYKKGIMFVEEPELFVHPGLQKQLMKIYATHERAENFMFFIATHSNHILDTTLYDNQISIFSVKKSLEESTSDPKFILQNLAHGDDNALTQLGVSNSSVFLANCTIWVEGVTDRMYIQKFMEVYAEANPALKRFKEGVHYSFVYSGGSNIAHYDFDQEGSFLKDRESPAVIHFCGKAFVVVDKDNTEDERQAWKQKRNEKLRELLGEKQFEQLEVREIENLLSVETLHAVVKSYSSWKDLPELDTLADDHDELKLLKENLQNELTKSRIGTFIDKTLIPALRPEIKEGQKSFKAPSGTINEKKSVFCNKAIQHIDNSSMTKEAEELVAKIYAFIGSQNHF